MQYPIHSKPSPSFLQQLHITPPRFIPRRHSSIKAMCLDEIVRLRLLSLAAMLRSSRSVAEIRSSSLHAEKRRKRSRQDMKEIRPRMTKLSGEKSWESILMRMIMSSLIRMCHVEANVMLYFSHSPLLQSTSHHTKKRKAHSRNQLQCRLHKCRLLVCRHPVISVYHVPGLSHRNYG